MFLLTRMNRGKRACLACVFLCFHRITQPVFVLPLHSVFVQMLNRVSDWTNPYDFGPGISDETFLSAYLMYRRTTIELSSLASCGVLASDPCSPLRNCPVCSPAHPGGGCLVLLRIDVVLHTMLPISLLTPVLNPCRQQLQVNCLSGCCAEAWQAQECGQCCTLDASHQQFFWRCRAADPRG